VGKKENRSTAQDEKETKAYLGKAKKKLEKNKSDKYRVRGTKGGPRFRLGSGGGHWGKSWGGGGKDMKNKPYEG